MASSDYCSKCIHYFGSLRCKAYGKIPNRFVTGQAKHDKVQDNQNGVYVFMDKSENIEDFLKK